MDAEPPDEAKAGMHLEAESSRADGADDFVRRMTRRSVLFQLVGAALIQGGTVAGEMQVLLGLGCWLLAAVFAFFGTASAIWSARDLSARRVLGAIFCWWLLIALVAAFTVFY